MVFLNEARPDGLLCGARLLKRRASGRWLVPVRTVYLNDARPAVCDACPDGVRIKMGSTPISFCFFSFPSLFPTVFSPKNHDILKSSRPILDPTSIA
jgi:hypothetical protein